MSHSQSIHGHLVINTLLAADKAWRRDELISAIRQQFGIDARFHTCSTDNLSAEELFDFLERRGRIAYNGEGYRLNKDVKCEADQESDVRDQESGIR